jgi:hypothetical protein
LFTAYPSSNISEWNPFTSNTCKTFTGFDVGEISEESPDDWEGLDASAAHIANLLSTEPADGIFEAIFSVKIYLICMQEFPVRSFYKILCAYSTTRATNFHKKSRSSTPSEIYEVMVSGQY